MRRLDENRSELNRQIAAAVLAGRFPKIGYLEVNDVCNNGIDIYNALQARFGPY